MSAKTLAILKTAMDTIRAQKTMASPAVDIKAQRALLLSQIYQLLNYEHLRYHRGEAGFSAVMLQYNKLEKLQQIKQQLADEHDQYMAQDNTKDEAADELATRLIDLEPAESVDLTEKPLDADQQYAVELATQRKSFCLIGAAGTGKTTTQRQLLAALILSGTVPLLEEGTKFLRQGKPGVAIVAYTRRARNTIRKYVPPELYDHTLTIHQLLEYEPVKTELEQADGTTTISQRFEPQRNAVTKLPYGLKVIVVEEASMVGADLFAKVEDALGHKVIWIFLGDLQQLPPPYDIPILGFKLLELPIVELKRVYRTANDSPIKLLAHEILAGKPIPDTDLVERYNVENGCVNFKFWQKKLDAHTALMTAVLRMQEYMKSGDYRPDKDVILIPNNVGFGSIALNLHLADYLGRTRNATVYEIIGGYERHYLAVGDLVMVDKEIGIIEEINRNARYYGTMPQNPSDQMDRWGSYRDIAKGLSSGSTEPDLTLDFFDIEALENAADTDIKERKAQASHTITVVYEDGTKDTLSTAGELNKLLFGYAMTIYKAQGCEWNRVFMIWHSSHNPALKREALYTAVTRAKKRLYIMAEKSTFSVGILRQAIRGTTLDEKLEYFRRKTQQRTLSRAQKQITSQE